MLVFRKLKGIGFAILPLHPERLQSVLVFVPLVKIPVVVVIVEVPWEAVLEESDEEKAVHQVAGVESFFADFEEVPTNFELTLN